MKNLIFILLAGLLAFSCAKPQEQIEPEENLEVFLKDATVIIDPGDGGQDGIQYRVVCGHGYCGHTKEWSSASFAFQPYVCWCGQTIQTATVTVRNFEGEYKFIRYDAP